MKLQGTNLWVHVSQLKKRFKISHNWKATSILSAPLPTLLVILRPRTQARLRKKKDYILLQKKNLLIFGSLRSSQPMGFVFLAWVKQLEFLVPKHLRETINCSCFCDSGYDANLFHFIQSFKCFYAATLSSDDCHNDTIERSEDLTIQVTMKILNNLWLVKIWNSNFPWVGQFLRSQRTTKSRGRGTEDWPYKWKMARPYIKMELWPVVSSNKDEKPVHYIQQTIQEAEQLL